MKDIAIVKSVEHIFEPRLLGPRTKDFNLLDPRIARTQVETDRQAQWLVDQFTSPNYKPAFLRIAWRLDNGTIHRLAGSALELGKNPRAYFITSARNEMRRRGVAQ